MAVLKKYNVTEADFDSSLIYYYSHADRLRDIYAEVNNRLTDNAKALGAAVGDISHYSQYGTTGDTANIWKEHTDILLMPRPTRDRYEFEVPVDTSFHLGDSFMFQFMSEYLWQSGTKDAVVCFVCKYAGDSIVQTISHVSVSGIAQTRIPAIHDKKLVHMNGYIFLSDGQDDTDARRMMFISQVQLIRFHDKKHDNSHEATPADTTNVSQKDSVQRNSNTRGQTTDTLRYRNNQRNGLQPISTHRGTAIHRVDERKTNSKTTN